VGGKVFLHQVGDWSGERGLCVPLHEDKVARTSGVICPNCLGKRILVLLENDLEIQPEMIIYFSRLHKWQAKGRCYGSDRSHMTKFR